MLTKTAMFQRVTNLIPTRAMVTTGQGRRSQFRRIWWHAYEAVQPVGLLRVPVGPHRMWVNTADTIISYCLIKHGLFEPQESAVVRSILRTGATFVDCGANIGYYTLLAASVIGSSGCIYAFEPAPQNHALLQRNIADNDLADIATSYACALGAETGETTIYLDQENHGAHSLYANNIVQVTETAAVPVRRLDDVLGEKRVDVIKIDTQGAEPDILSGASRILSRDHPVLLLEWWPWGLRTTKGSTALVDFLRAFDYRVGIVRDRAHPYIEKADWRELVENSDPTNPDLTLTLICAREEFDKAFPRALLSS